MKPPQWNLIHFPKEYYKKLYEESQMMAWAQESIRYTPPAPD